MAAVLQLSFLGARSSAASWPADPVVVIRPQASSPPESRMSSTASVSNPRASFSAGRLSRRAGMAVVRLAAWLRVMGVSGVRAR